MQVRDRKRRLPILTYNHFHRAFVWRSKGEIEWDNMPPIGWEFGSPDYDELMHQDELDRRANLTALVARCTEVRIDNHEDIDAIEIVDIENVRSALHELGHVVSQKVAATIWAKFSKSMMTDWMTGAETVNSAKKSLLLNCMYQADMPSVFAERYSNLNATADREGKTSS